MTRCAALAPPSVSIVGALITTAAAVVFIALAIAAAAGLFDNPYAGLVVFVAAACDLRPRAAADSARHVAAQRAQLRRDPTAVAEWPVLDFRRPSVRRTALVSPRSPPSTSSILLLAGYGSLHWMESPSFCGQTCHTPMHPQFTAWQDTTALAGRLRRSATSAKARGRSCTTSWPACGSSSTS